MSVAPGLQGRVVLITGASGSLGGEMAVQLAQAGAVVIASGRNLRKLDKLHARIEAEGGICQLYPMDLAGADPEALAECIEGICGAHGGLDVLIHCAADFPGLTPLMHTDPARLAQGIHVNLTARVWLTQAALPALQQRSGVVVFVHDQPERVSSAYWGGYGAVQSAQAALAAMLDGEMAGRVKVLGYVPSPMPTALRARAYSHEVGTIRSPEIVARECIEQIAASVGGWVGCEEASSLV